jgi:hypothetical protein
MACRSKLKLRPQLGIRKFRKFRKFRDFSDFGKQALPEFVLALADL